MTEVLRARLAENDDPEGGRVDDGATVALVIEGGGMRGIVSASMACAVEASGVLGSVDLIVGTSSGAVNAAATARGAITRFTEAYTEVFSAREYIDVRRLARGRAVVDSPRIMRHLDHLYDFRSLAAPEPRPRLAVVATDVAAAEASALTDFTDGDDVLGAIHASGLLPLIGGRPLELRGRRWLDGGIVEALPVRSAAGLGATHAVVLATRAPERPPVPGVHDRVVRRYLASLNPDLADQYAGRTARYSTALAQARAGRVGGLRTLLLAPAPTLMLPSRLDTDPGRLRTAQRAAYRSAWETLAALEVAPPLTRTPPTRRSGHRPVRPAPPGSASA